jgi:hypothetical protein
MLTIFGKKKLTENAVANIFVNALTDLIEKGFEEIASLINEDQGFSNSPQINADDFDQFMFIVVAGNLCYIPEYFQSGQDNRIVELSLDKLSTVYGMEKMAFVQEVNEYKKLMLRVNHPSKNTLYGMSKAVFYKYNLNQFQDNYFKTLNTPNPIFLKRLNELMSYFLWNWEAFFERYKVV